MNKNKNKIIMLTVGIAVEYDKVFGRRKLNEREIKESIESAVCACSQIENVASVRVTEIKQCPM